MKNQCLCGNEILKGKSGLFANTCSYSCGKKLRKMKLLWTPKQHLTKEIAQTFLDKNKKFTGNKKADFYQIEYYWCKTMSDYVWCILYDISKPPVCQNPNCNKHTKKYGWNDFRNYCSPKCNLNSISTTNKINATNQIRYGVNRPCQSKIILEKKATTCIVKYGVENPFMSSECMGHQILKRTELEDYEHYHKNVWDVTNMQNLALLENFEKRGNYLGWSLDHKYSSSQGFMDGILPFYIGQSNNLEMLTIKENSAKGAKCSITKDQLFNLS